ncbi:prolipoprotein diacylglyceryl transferase [Mesobaculum littorinae]|uniref:Phosphatidylglycerol--prolipoprotein diacylglyceryl transferase n=1 Tax=Mesobaculum littorinae TaxID=2486419 RepID=A0A438AKP0_9RHOB|nr:prolipoprotein diacylglyceryl transferase [Mesobaculum littorinae]RVV99147.1 prolipoprotein diacylglyceryl transferase [Mesobaculum littorinae]
MQAVLSFPDISSEVFSISVGGFDFALRWYALAYIVGILAGWRLAVMTVRRDRLWPGGRAPIPADAIEDLVTAVILGIVLGGRLGFVLFYQPGYYLENPAQIPAIWTGGMSFHGGMIGVVLGGAWFLRRHPMPVLSLLDLLSLAVPPGLLLGRIANFVNAELWGRPSTAPWAVIFPGARAQSCTNVDGLCARHPSQLYEAGLEGLVLGGLLIWLVYALGALKRPGFCVGVFLSGYALARIFVELFRQADPQFITAANPMGYVVQLGDFGLSMGQLLSLPMLALGLGFLIVALRRRPAPA